MGLCRNVDHNNLSSFQSFFNDHYTFAILYLYKFLLQVFGNSQNADMSDKFRDMSAFCLQVSRLMVNEVRRRASNQSTEAASRAIALFLEIEASEEASNGWLLLTSLNLLAATADPALIQASAISL